MTGVDIVLGALGLVNLVLLLGVIRRLNEHTRVLAQTLAAADPVPVMLTAGARVGDFHATTVDGERVDRSDLTRFTLVGFVTASCPACAESLPAFLDRAATVPGGRANVLAVVVGASRPAQQLADRLRPVARVVLERDEGGLVRAFGVVGFPAYALLSGDSIVVSHHDVHLVPEPASDALPA